RPARQQHQARKRAADDTETAEEQRARLQAQALRKKYLRRDESEAERSARLQDQALRQKSLRNEESEAEKSSRLHEQALRQHSLRKEESEAEKWARQREQALRQKNLRTKETELGAANRQLTDKVRHEATRSKETPEERLDRAIADSFLHQINRLEETEQEAAAGREANMEWMAGYRATENEEETADRREEDRLRTELQREHQFEREREEEELRARNALQHAEIVPVETADHEAFLREMHLDRNRAGNRRTHRIACKDIVVEDRVHLLDIGDLTKICAECDAKHFEKEMPKDQKFQRCCGKGKVIIPPPKPCPQPLASLLQNQHPKSKQFMKQIRNYNSAHAFASLGANQSPPPNRGPYCYRIHGQIYHQITPLGPTPNPRYADLYFLDSAQATDYRANIQAMSGCCRILMVELDAMLREKNPYALVYKMMRQVLEEEYVQRQAANLPHYTVGMIITLNKLFLFLLDNQTDNEEVCTIQLVSSRLPNGTADDVVVIILDL
ncbi:hypothetical protein DAPPUDRAFT_120618, partial [Daphnia pulex]